MIGLLWGILSKIVAYYHDMIHECKNRCVTKSTTLLSCVRLKISEYDVNVTIVISYVCSGCGSAQVSGCQCAVWQVISQGGAIICVTMSAIFHVAMLL